MIYRFGEVEIDSRARELRYGGSSIQAEPKVLDVILYLVERRDRVVTKEELLESLWEGRLVSDSVMARAIHAARKVLRDPDAIKTFYGRGYRFVAEVSERDTLAEGTRDEVHPSGEPSAAWASRRARRVLIGRERQSALARECLGAALAGEPRTLIITGEAGIGKTTLCEHIALLVGERGSRALWGRCSEVPGAPPFWPFVQLLREMLESLPTEQKDPLLAQHPEVGKLVSVAEIEPPSTGDAEQVRFRLFDGITRFIRNASVRCPLTLLLDDLHRADTPSLRLFHFLVQQLSGARVLTVATYRDAEMRAEPDRARWMQDLSRHNSACAIQLDGLNRQQIGAFIRATTGAWPGAATLDYLADQTAGNPFYLSQLVPLVGEMNLPSQPAGSANPLLPRSVHDAIASHLSGLPVAVRKLLQVAAVIGRGFDSDLLAEVTGSPRGALLETLQAALDASLIAEDQPRMGDFRFVHVLIRDVLSSSLTPPRRSELHRKIGEAIERRWHGKLDLVATELAHHFVQAATVTDAEKAVRYSLLAGDVALDRLAYEDAARHFEATLALVERGPEGEAHQLCDLLLKLGTAQTRSGQLDAARLTFRRTAELARRIGAAERLAAVALDLAPGFFSIETGIFDAYLLERLEEALGPLEDKDPLMRVRLLGRLAIALYWTGRSDRRSELCAEAAEIAEQIGTPRARLHAQSARHAALWSPENLDERMQLSGELITLSSELGDVDAELVSRCFRITNLLEAGDIESVREEIARFKELAHTVRQPECVWMSDMYETMLALLRGEFARVEQFGLQSIELGNRIRHHNAYQSGGAYVALSRAEVGGVEHLLPAIEEYAANYPAVVAWRALLAFASSRAGDRDRAQREFDRLAASGFQIPKDTCWLGAMAWLAETAAFLDRASDAQKLYDQTEPFAGRYVVLGYGVGPFGAVDRYLGLLALTQKKWTDAIFHLETAVQHNLRLGAPPLVAHSQRELAAALFERGRPGDHSWATRLLAESAAIAERLGMAWLVRKIQSMA